MTTDPQEYKNPSLINMMQQILIYFAGFWLICFAFAIYLARDVYDDLVEDCGWMFSEKYIKFVFILVCFIRAPFLIRDFLVEWYTIRKAEKLLEKLKRKYNIKDEEIWHEQSKPSGDQSQKEGNTK